MLAVCLPFNCRCRGVSRGTCVGVGSVNHLRAFEFLVAAAQAIVKKVNFTASIATLGQVVAIEAKLATAHVCSKAFTAEPNSIIPCCRLPQAAVDPGAADAQCKFAEVVCAPRSPMEGRQRGGRWCNKTCMYYTAAVIDTRHLSFYPWGGKKISHWQAQSLKRG
jgi:hypothetical protein